MFYCGDFKKDGYTMNILIMSKIFAKSGVGSHIMDLSETLKKQGNNREFSDESASFTNKDSWLC